MFWLSVGCYPIGMKDSAPVNALLPAGLRDVLPPEAETEAAAVAAIMDAFSLHGYQRVKPPLMEFEDSLLGGTGAAVSEQTLRLVDPDTHRVIGLRADITPQVARIAATRLAHAARPLRLCYAGQTLRVRAAGLSADRQVAQAGLELIGADSSEADAEVVVVAAEALQSIGLLRVSFDLTMPPLVQALLEAAAPDPVHRAALAHALDRKDAAEVSAHAGARANILATLLLAAGPAEGALAALQAAELDPVARLHADRLAATAAAIRARAPALRLTVDPVEFRGFRYHTGVCTTVYAPGRHEELGRGGRYLCGAAEPATGLTLFPDAVLRAAPAQQPRQRVFVPYGSDAAAAAKLRRKGFATVAGLDALSDPMAAARDLSCAYLFRARTLEPVGME